MPKPPPSNSPIPPNLDGVFRVAMEWTDTLTGQQAVNVLHVSNQAGPSPDPGVVAADLDSSAHAGMFASIPSTANVTRCVIVELKPGGSFGEFDLINWVGSDTSGDGFMPAVSALVQLGSGVRGMASRGRIFLPFTQESVAANGRLGTAAHGTLQGAWETFIGNLPAASAAEMQLAIVSLMFRDPTTGNYVAPNYQYVSAITVDPILCTQRRRQDRVGL